MNKTLLLFFIFITTACNDSFYTQTVMISDTDLPNECQGLIAEINSDWKKSTRFGHYQEADPDFIIKKLILDYSARKMLWTIDFIPKGFMR